MIQRVQSVYLLLVTVLMSFMLIRPYAELTISEGKILTFHAQSIKVDTGNEKTTPYKTTVPVLLLVLITGLLSVGNIFMYHRRIVQLRICLINMILLIVLLVIMFIYFSSTKGALANTYHAFRIPVIFPFMGLIFNMMAYRAIHHDELLVNSYNRIR